MNLITITRTVFEGRLYYALGRFRWVRLSYSFIQKNFFLVRQLFSSSQKNGQLNLTKTLFPNINIEQMLTSLRRDAVALNLKLPTALVETLLNFAQNNTCRRSVDYKNFRFSDVKEGKLSDGIPVVIGFVENPSEHPAVNQICFDPLLLQIVKEYLGYFPKKITPRLVWSFVNNTLTDDYRVNHWQTVRYHFDVDGYNFVYANFYLTPVDLTSGAHVMIKGSHNWKPLHMLFHSAVQSDQTVLAHFGQHNEYLIEGDAGFGFIQDSSCYHKALAPVAKERLLLQIRFT